MTDCDVTNSLRDRILGKKGGNGGNQPMAETGQQPQQGGAAAQGGENV